MQNSKQAKVSKLSKSNADQGYGLSDEDKDKKIQEQQKLIAQLQAQNAWLFGILNDATSNKEGLEGIRHLVQNGFGDSANQDVNDQGHIKDAQGKLSKAEKKLKLHFQGLAAAHGGPPSIVAGTERSPSQQKKGRGRPRKTESQEPKVASQSQIDQPSTEQLQTHGEGDTQEFIASEENVLDDQETTQVQAPKRGRPSTKRSKFFRVPIPLPKQGIAGVIIGDTLKQQLAAEEPAAEVPPRKSKKAKKVHPPQADPLSESQPTSAVAESRKRGRPKKVLTPEEIERQEQEALNPPPKKAPGRPRKHPDGLEAEKPKVPGRKRGRPKKPPVHMQDENAEIGIDTVEPGLEEDAEAGPDLGGESGGLQDSYDTAAADEELGETLRKRRRGRPKKFASQETSEDAVDDAGLDDYEEDQPDAYVDAVEDGEDDGW